MKCFNCGFKTKTIYPNVHGDKYVQKMCLACGWKSYAIAVPKPLSDEWKQEY